MERYLQRDEDDIAVNRLDIYDLFCGIGGFSTGARDAGHRVAFGCDLNIDALCAHAANHPEAGHAALEFPVDEDAILRALPGQDAQRQWHLHGSPPCTDLSNAKTDRASESDKQNALDLTTWFLNLAVHKCAPTSFSFEQVAVARVCDACEAFQRANHRDFAYAVLHLNDYGIPQLRRRIIGGTPWLVRRLLRRFRSFPSYFSAPQCWIGSERCLASHICWPKYRTSRTTLKPTPRKLAPSEIRKTHVSKPCYSVTTISPLYWISEAGDVDALLSVDALARLQTFPRSTVFPSGLTLARRLIGNAVPPRIAMLLLQDYRAPRRALRGAAPAGDNMEATLPDAPTSPCACIFEGVSS